MSTLKNKVAVITGGNSGIGFATAKLFIEQGAQVVITGRDQSAVDNAVRQLGQYAKGLVLDVTDFNDLSSLREKVKKHHERIDILFVNAGISLNAGVMDVTEEHFDKLFDTNVKGVYFTIQQVLPLINESGSIILNSSATIHRGYPGFSVYTGTKATLIAFAKSISAELLDRKIRVNVVSPGPVSTPLYDKMGFPIEQAKAAYADTVPVKRFAEPAEIASVVKFLASQESSFIVGEEIIAGGGIGTL